MRKGMDCSSAGKLGWRASSKTHQQQKEKRIEVYAEKPNRCYHCNRELPYKERHKTFCNTSCAATYNNTHKQKKEHSRCLRCGNAVKRKASVYCTNRCFSEHQHETWLTLWLQGKTSGTTCHGLSVSNHIRRYLTDTFGHRCSICGLSEWMGNSIPLVLDHISGNGQDSTPGNVRLVCGNCNMQLPTFAGKNHGKGRMARKKWDDKLQAAMKK